MVRGAGDTEPVQMIRYPYGVCGRGVGVISNLCVRCGKWCHKRCGGHCSLNISEAFVCPGCTAESRNRSEQPIHTDWKVVREVNSFCYLGDVMSSERGVERSVKARTAAA